MTTKGIMTDFYAQFEKLNEKLDKMIKEDKEQSLTIYNLNLQIENLTKELQKAYELNEKLTEENKNSNNSSKPSSTNMVIPRKKKTGAIPRKEN